MSLKQVEHCYDSTFIQEQSRTLHVQNKSINYTLIYKQMYQLFACLLASRE